MHLVYTIQYNTKNETQRIQHKKYNTKNITQKYTRLKIQREKYNTKHTTQKNTTRKLCFISFFSSAMTFVSIQMFSVQKEVHPMKYIPLININPKNHRGGKLPSSSTI